MPSILEDLSKPFFILAPMDDVTDTVFRRLIAELAPPDLFFTEFVNVDALQSAGRESTLKRLRLGPLEGRHGTSGSARSQDGAVRKPVPIIAQLWGLKPENFYKSAQEITQMGFDGIDLNFGCPDKNVVRNGACSALILPQNRGLAVEIINACREGAPALPLSVKTRLGFNEIDHTWHELLLQQKLNMLSIHGRTKKQMSNVPADWDAIGEIRKLRDSVSPATLMIGNGDVLTRNQGLELAAKHGLDGIMIGRGIFQDPFVFSKKSLWESYTKQQRIALYRRHVELFAETWQSAGQRSDRKIHTLNKFCKVYIQSFDGAKEMREKLMAANSTKELLGLLQES